MIFWYLACKAPEKEAERVPVEIEDGGEIRCEDPSRREEQAFDRVVDGDWSAQSYSGEGDNPGGGLAVADFNGDGWEDFFLPNWKQDRLYLSEGAPSWKSASFPVESATGESASVVDWDADGDPDLLVGNRSPNRLYRNDAGEMVPQENLGMEGGNAFTVSTVWGDVNGDGALDLFVSTHFYGPASPEYIASGDFPDADPNALYLSNGDGSFRATTLPDAAVHAPTYVASLLDVDGDSDLDLYLVNDFGRYIQPNLLLLNDGKGSFESAPENGLQLALCGMGVSVADLNDDLNPDFLLSGWDELHLMLSSESGWYDAAKALGLTTGEGQHVAWGSLLEDFDNDGDTDAFVGYGMLQMPPEEAERFEELVGWPNPSEQPDALYLQDQGVFSDAAPAWGIDNPHSTHGSLATDINQDGWLDLVTREMDAPAELYLSRCGASSWLELTLSQPGSNPDAIGARVVLEAGGKKMSRWMMAGGQSVGVGGPARLHFGLGEEEQVERLTVYWPDGTMSEVEDLPVRRRLKLSR